MDECLAGRAQGKLPSEVCGGDCWLKLNRDQSPYNLVVILQLEVIEACETIIRWLRSAAVNTVPVVFADVVLPNQSNLWIGLNQG